MMGRNWENDNYDRGVARPDVLERADRLNKDAKENGGWPTPPSIFRKPWLALTDNELNVLTEVQRARYLEILCLENDIPALPPYPTNPGPDPTTEGRIEAYRVLDLVFAAYEDADAVATLLNRCSLLSETTDYTITGYPRYYQPVDQELAVEKIKIKTEEAYNRRAAELATYQEAKTQYDSDLKTYKEIAEQRRSISAAMSHRILEASKRRIYREMICQEFTTCMELAEFRPSIARAFLLKRYHDAQTVCPELFRDELPPPARAITFQD
jgi:hypothetical protein